MEVPGTANGETASTQAPVVIKDSSIKSSIKAKFAADFYDDFALSHIDVNVNHHGVVALEGKVPSQDAADRAVSIARLRESCTGHPLACPRQTGENMPIQRTIPAESLGNLAAGIARLLRPWLPVGDQYSAIQG